MIVFTTQKYYRQLYIIKLQSVALYISGSHNLVQSPSLVHFVHEQAVSVGRQVPRHDDINVAVWQNKACRVNGRATYGQVYKHNAKKPMLN